MARVVQLGGRVDVLVCPRCCGPARIVATITEPAVIRAILHPLREPARAPPREEDSLTFGIIHTDGSGEDGLSVRQLSGLYEELRNADREHGDVAVVNEATGWCLTAHRDGRLVFENLGGGDARHMIPVSRETVLDHWRRLIDGDIDGLMAEPWKSGYR